MKSVRVGAPGQLVWVEQDEQAIGCGEVLLKPLACGICSSDVRAVRRGNPQNNAWALGHELVGLIVAAGEGARYRIGERVVAAPYVPCGDCYFCLRGQFTLCEHLFEQGLDPGGLAERVRIPRPIVERGLFPVPEKLPSDIAALTEPVACCVQASEACSVGPGQAVLVVGDGPMGLMNAAVARACGASLTVVAGLTEGRLRVALEFADMVVDVSKEDVSQRVRAVTGGRGADVVIVAVPRVEAVLDGLRALRRGGVLNMSAGTPEGTTVPLDLRRLHYDEWRITGSFGVAPARLRQALSLLSEKRVNVAPLITGRFPFAQAAEAVEQMAEMVGMKAVVLFE